MERNQLNRLPDCRWRFRVEIEGLSLRQGFWVAERAFGAAIRLGYSVERH
jgi:hypothetical protein